MDEDGYSSLYKRLTTDTNFVKWVEDAVDSHLKNDAYVWLGRRALAVLVLVLGKYWDKIPEILKWWN